MQFIKLEGEFITLSQLLKRVNAVSSGGEVKVLLQTETVSVNGEKETRRGRKLRTGDQVQIGTSIYRLA
jgi:ribosome-associated protein